MHTTNTLRLLDIATIEFGKHVRKFAEVTCTAFNTTELPKETAARMRRLAQKTQASSGDASGPTQPPSTTTTTTPNAALPANTTTAQAPSSSAPSTMRTFSLSTYKLHSAGGHYTDAIREYGTTDSYTTQLVRFLLVIANLLVYYLDRVRLNIVEQRRDDICEQARNSLKSKWLQWISAISAYVI